MGYNLHIARLQPDAECWDEDDVLPISLEEWTAAVAEIKNARLQTDDHIITRESKHGLRMQIPNRHGNVEIYSVADEAWIPAIS